VSHELSQKINQKESVYLNINEQEQSLLKVKSLHNKLDNQLTD